MWISEYDMYHGLYINYRMPHSIKRVNTIYKCWHENKTRKAFLIYYNPVTTVQYTIDKFAEILHAAISDYWRIYVWVYISLLNNPGTGDIFTYTSLFIFNWTESTITECNVKFKIYMCQPSRNKTRERALNTIGFPNTIFLFCDRRL